MNRTKVVTFSKLIFEDKEPKIERKIVTREFDPLFRKWTKINEQIERTNDLTQHDPPLLKKIEFTAIFEREATNTRTSY